LVRIWLLFKSKKNAKIKEMAPDFFKLGPNEKDRKKVKKGERENKPPQKM